MKPFLLLQLRPIDEAANNEYEAFLKYGNLEEPEVHRIRMEKEGIPYIDIENYSGVIVGGGPSNVSDNEEEKYEYQKLFEPQLHELLISIIQKDVPYLGTCYGLGVLNKHLGASVSKVKYAEKIGAVEIKVTEAGAKDELLEGIPLNFLAFGGHKEACQDIPEDAILLASSMECPYQMIRIKNNIYATQFHTELDLEGLSVRIEAYKNHGYFLPHEAKTLSETIKTFKVEYPSLILKRFVQKYRQKEHPVFINKPSIRNQNHLPGS